MLNGNYTGSLSHPVALICPPDHELAAFSKKITPVVGKSRFIAVLVRELHLDHFRPEKTGAMRQR